MLWCVAECCSIRVCCTCQKTQAKETYKRDLQKRPLYVKRDSTETNMFTCRIFLIHFAAVCCSVCVAACCSVLQCFAVCCSVLQCVAVCCSVLQCVAVCCSVLQYVCSHAVPFGSALLRDCCSVLQCVVECCSVLQCVAVCCSACIYLPHLFDPLCCARIVFGGFVVLGCLCCSVLQ